MDLFHDRSTVMTDTENRFGSGIARLSGEKCVGCWGQPVVRLMAAREQNKWHDRSPTASVYGTTGHLFYVTDICLFYPTDIYLADRLPGFGTRCYC